MKKTKKSRVNKPNALLIFVVAPFIKLYFRFAYRHRVDKSALKASGLKPPYLVVAGHSGWLDYLIIGSAMFPVRMNYVAAYNFFRDKTLKFLFTLLGVISKYQFTRDITAIKKIKYCIDSGRVVAVFPSGCLSNDGRPGGFAVFGIAKLIKMLKVPVVAIRTDGGYLTRPRWNEVPRRGRLETHVTPILTAEEAATLSERDIYARVTGAIDYDDYKWQRANMVPYKAKNAAVGVEFVLYKCPKCGSEFKLRSEGDRMICEVCGNSVHFNKYLMFEPDAPDTVYFDAIDKWFDYQKECVDAEISRPDFKLTAPTELLWNEPEKYGYQHLGHGTLELTREAVVYAGTIDGREERKYFPMKSIPMVPYDTGSHIEIADGSYINRFKFDDPRQLIKWVMAIRQIRDKYYEGDGADGESF